MTGAQDGRQKDRHLLIAADETESSQRAVLYVADMLGGVPGFRVTVLNVITPPEEDFFSNAAEGETWMLSKRAEAGALLERYRQLLVQAGFPEDRVAVRICENGKRSLAAAILEMRCDESCCTVVVGRRHKTKAEEFLFGSTSATLIREAKNCAVWVVE